MSALLTTIAIFLPLSGLFHGLRHWIYGLHIAIVAGSTAALHHYWLGDAEAFSAALFLTIFIMHIVSINMATYLAYFLDKRASKRGSWRIPERTLQHFALIGGSPSAALAQRILRHKTQKKSFKLIFLLTLALQIAILIIFIITNQL